MRIFVLALATLSLAGCVTGTDPAADLTDIPEREVASEGTCNARGLEDAFLKTYVTQEIGSELLKQSGAKTLQWIPPRSQVTMDIRQDRLRVGYDDMMEINRIVCQ